MGIHYYSRFDPKARTSAQPNAGLRRVVSVIGVMVMAVLVHTSLGNASQFHSDSYGYNIDVPAGWVQMPPDVIQEAMAMATKQNAAVSIMWDAGFQLASETQWFGYPYVVVQVIPYEAYGVGRQINEDEFSKVMRSFSGGDYDQLVEENVSSELSSLIDELEPGVPELDIARRRFLWPMDMLIQGDGPVRGLSAGHFGRESIVVIAFYSRLSEWDKYADVRSKLIASFRFDAAQAYSEQLALANPSPPSFWDGVLNKALTGALLGGLLGALFGIRYARKAHKRKKAGTAGEDTPKRE